MSVQVYGIFLPPPPVAGEEYTGPLFREGPEADIALNGFRHKPVLLEHRNPPIGKVVDCFRGSKREFIGHLEIYTNTPRGKQALEGLENGTYKGLSVGLSLGATSDFKYWNNFHIKEISIVGEGDQPHSHILGHGAINDLFYIYNLFESGH